MANMDPNLEGFFDRFQALIDDCKVQIAGLTQTELHWSPGESMNSLAVLAAHTAGAARFWMMDVVMGQATGRDRDQEFAVSGQNTEALAGLLQREGIRIARRTVAKYRDQMRIERAQLRRRRSISAPSSGSSSSVDGERRRIA